MAIPEHYSPRRQPSVNPILHRPVHVTLTSYEASPRRGADVFRLEITYKPIGFTQTYHEVYVPPALQAPFRDEKVLSFHMETLENNSRACHALRGSPGYVVMGVDLTDGSRLTEIPSEWRRLRRWCFLTGAVCLGIAGALLARDIGVLWNILAASLCVLGVARCRAGCAVPNKPFWITAEHGDFSTIKPHSNAGPKGEVPTTRSSATLAAAD
jgi:hypothetical protein